MTRGEKGVLWTLTFMVILVFACVVGVLTADAADGCLERNDRKRQDYEECQRRLENCRAHPDVYGEKCYDVCSYPDYERCG